jgi:hypothetical protein
VNVTKTKQKPLSQVPGSDLPPDTGDDSLCNVRRLRAEITRLRTALEQIQSYPVHSEPVGGAYAMQDIAHDALYPNTKLSDAGGH